MKETFQRKMRRCEILLRRELLPQYNPPIESAFTLIEERLSVAKDLYLESLRLFQSAGGVARTEKERSEIEARAEMAKNGYIGIDRAIENIINIRSTLKLAPLTFSDERRVCSNE